MPAVVWGVLLLGTAALLAWAFVARWLLNNPRGDVEAGIVWRALCGYSRLVHRLRVEGVEHIPARRDAGPLIVVVNHASGVDPVLVQVVCPFEIRWVMAEDMRHPLGEWLWQWARIIFVNRPGGDIRGTREAIRHLEEGGVLGIFPEGGIERPPRQILPFLPGVGFIIKRSGAPVLPAIVEGPPDVEPAWASLYRRSHSTVRFMPPLDYSGFEGSAHDVAEDLRARYIAWTGWPPNDTYEG